MIRGSDCIDVIIPCYNCSKYISQAIESVLSQTYNNYRIIVVDDASTDNVDMVLNKYINNITILRHPNNKGVSASRNTAIKSSESRYIAFLDADDVWMSNKLERQICQFNSNPEIGLSFTSLIDSDFNLNPIAPPRKMQKRISENVFSELYQEPFSIPLSTVMIRREAIEKCGYFDESLKGVEDYELWLRISMFFPVSCLNEPLSYRRQHSEGITANYLLGEKLSLEIEAIDKCAKFAEKHNLKLPITSLERKRYSIKRRMKLALKWNEVESAKYYFNMLRENKILDLKDTMVFTQYYIIAKLRNIIKINN